MGSSGDRLCQTSPIPRSPDGDNKMLCTALNGRGVHTDLELKRLRAITKPQKCLSLRSLKDFGTEIFTKDSTGGEDSNMIYNLLRFLY